jgi:hypothetical protein
MHASFSIVVSTFAEGKFPLLIEYIFSEIVVYCMRIDQWRG